MIRARRRHGLLGARAFIRRPACTARSGSHRASGLLVLRLIAGDYRCDQGRALQFRQVSADAQTAVLKWNERDYPMRAVGARSGALRYEHADSGLVWLMIPSKSMLLDTRQGQRLADACRT